MLAPNKNPVALANKITELSVRLNVTEEQNRLLREENQRLQQIELDHQKLKSEHQQTVERKVLLEEEVRWLKAQYYGRSTQSSDAAEQNHDQQMLFNEAEVLAAIEAADEAHRERTTKIDAHERKRSADSGRKAIPDHFPRIEIEHDLAPDQKLCTRCAVPHPLTRMGQEIRECYRFEPPKISVEQHIRPTYVCEELHEAPITAPAPPVILPKSMASPSLLAHVTNSKFNLGLPLYRVSQDLKRYRMDLSPGTLGTWMSIVGGEKIVPVVNLIRDALFTAPFMHIDETPLQILRSDKATGSDHYIVVRSGGPPGQRIILYDYLASRTTAGLKQFFMGPDGAYQGKLVSDGLERYDDIAAELKLLHFGCLTHCRTMFFKARKVSNLPRPARSPTRRSRTISVRSIGSRDRSRRCAQSISSAGNPCRSRRCCSYAKRSPSRSWRSSKPGSIRSCPPPRRTARSARRSATRLGSGRSWSGIWITRKSRWTTITANSRSNTLRLDEKRGSSATMPAAPRRAPTCSRW